MLAISHCPRMSRKAKVRPFLHAKECTSSWTFEHYAADSETFPSRFCDGRTESRGEGHANRAAPLPGPPSFGEGRPHLFGPGEAGPRLRSGPAAQPAHRPVTA